MNRFEVPRPSSINRVQQPLTLEAVSAIAPYAFAPMPLIFVGGLFVVVVIHVYSALGQFLLAAVK